MSDSKVKVGQRFEWTGSASGGLYTVVSVRNAIAMLTDSDGHRGVMDTKQPAPQWKRVQDAPEAKPSQVETCAEEPWKAAFRDAMKPWKRGDTETPWFAECATAPFQQSECCWCDGPHASVACPERYPVVDWYNAVYLCGGELHPIKKAFPEAAPFQEDACSARCGTLPQSEQLYLEGSIGENEPAEQAINEVRRRVAALRSWPTCPVSGEAYRIEARVSEETNRGARCNRLGSFERVRTWQASFCCPTCGRGGK